MLTFLRLKKVKGKDHRVIYFRTRSKKYAKEKDRYISKSKSLLIEGMDASGKSKEIKKLFDRKNEVYIKEKEFIFLKASDSLSDWFQANLKKSDANKLLEDQSLSDEEKEEIEENINKQYIKIQMLIRKTKGAVLFIDDIDQLSGKKLEVVKDLVKVSKLVIATCKNKRDINKTILNYLDTKKYQEIHLKSNSSYDATNILFIVIILALLTTGNLSVAAVLMAGRFALKEKGK